MFNMKNFLIIFPFIVFTTSLSYGELNDSQKKYDNAKILFTSPWPRYEFTDDQEGKAILVKGSWITDQGGNFMYIRKTDGQYGRYFM